jgi:imidazolonepropionase-like amidohydrolase
MKIATISLAIVLAHGQRAGPAAQVLVIRGGAVVDTRTGQVLENRTVVVEGDRIRRVAPATEEVATPPHAQVVDARERWILPGLIDMHVHGSTRPDVPLELYVVNGVTSIRDLGGPLTLLRGLREELQAGKRVGPRVFFVGPLLDGNPPAAPSMSIIVDTPERAASAVDFLVDQSVDAIKVYNGISAPVLQALVRTASRRNVPVVGHVPRTITASRAVEIGMRVIEHSPIRAVDLEAWGVLTKGDAQRIQAAPSVTAREAMVWRRVDLKAQPVATLIAQLAAAEVFLDPTLSTDEFDSLFLYPAQAFHCNNRFLKQAFVDEALGPEHEALKVPSELQAAAVEGIEKRRAFIGMCHRTGVRVVAGTDGPGIGRLAPGFGLHYELELLVKAGLLPMDALRAATFNAALALGREKDLGVIQEGMLADIVIVRADPRLSIDHAAEIDAVVLRGQLLDRKALDAMLDRVAAEARP